MSQDIEERVVELETRLSFQEDTLQSLNQVITEQDKTIMQLQELVRHLAEKLSDMEYSLEQGAGKAPANERPPHY